VDETYIKQLMLAKYLFRQGEKSLDKHSAMACGVAISHFQDAVEMLLYAVVKERDVGDAKKWLAFHDLWRLVDDSIQPHKLPVKAAMTELNTARVSFKHYGNLPAPSDCEKHLAYTRQFLAMATQVVFGKDFESVSLANLIGDEKMRGMLKQAEHHLERDEASECMVECAKAHYLASRLPERILPRMRYFMTAWFEDAEHPGRKSMGDLGHYLNRLRDISLAAILDVPATDFFRYAGLSKAMPSVTERGGEFFVSPQEAKYSQEDIHFAVRYVTEYALAVQEHMRILQEAGGSPQQA